MKGAEPLPLDRLAYNINFAWCVSPGLVGFGQASSPPAPMMPPASGNPLSTNSRMVIAAYASRSPPSRRTAWLWRCPYPDGKLRIELLGKGFDLRLVDDERSTGEALAHKEIVEIEPLVRVLRIGFDHATPTLLHVTRNA